MTYTTGSAISRIVGTDMGHVATHNSGNTDLGEPIPYRLRTKWYDWGTVATTKVIEELTAICEKAQGTTLQYKIDETLDWKTIGTLKQLATSFTKQSIRFQRIKFQLSGMSRNEAPVFLGIDVTKGLQEGLTAYGK